MTKREHICSQMEHCLSCPLSVKDNGKDCRKLSLKEIKEILNRKYGVANETKKA